MPRELEPHSEVEEVEERIRADMAKQIAEDPMFYHCWQRVIERSKDKTRIGIRIEIVQPERSTIETQVI